MPGNINAFDISPVILIVGVDDIASLNVAVIVTTFELYTKLSESESVRDTVGGVLSWFWENEETEISIANATNLNKNLIFFTFFDSKTNF